MFKAAFASRRGLIPVDAWYEWQTTPEGKKPFAFALHDRTPITLGGIWEGWRPEGTGKVLRTFCLITTTPNAIAAEVHDRMPVSVQQEDWLVWLGEREGDASSLLRPAPDEYVEAWPVSPCSKRVVNNGPGLLKPVFSYRRVKGKHAMSPQKIGLISDTHGLLRPEAVDALRGSDVILHAGDIGKREILIELERLAPVAAIKGNVDKGAWCADVPDTAAVRLAGPTVAYMIHSVADLDVDLEAEGYQFVISGHSHKSGFHWEEGVLFINPGSAGPRRFSLPVTVARLVIDGDDVDVEIVELPVEGRLRSLQRRPSR